MEQGDNRAGPRIGTEVFTTLRLPDGSETEVVLTNMSSGGFRFKHERNLLPGDRVELRTGKSDYAPAEIVWSVDGEAGGEFLEPPGAGGS